MGIAERKIKRLSISVHLPVSRGIAKHPERKRPRPSAGVRGICSPANFCADVLESNKVSREPVRSAQGLKQSFRC